MTLFPTMEIGSLPKFSWRTRPFRGQEITDADIALAKEWGDRLRVEETGDLLRLLSKRREFSSEDRDLILDYSIRYAIAMQERAGDEFGVPSGLDLLWTGEQARTEMYETPVSSISGFSFIGHVRSFDNKYWRMASVASRPRYLRNYHIDEFEVAKRRTARTLKVPVTDAITVMAWSDLHYYKKQYSRSSLPPSLRGFNARRDFVLDLSKVIRRVIQELISKGAQEVQLDIPAATQYQTPEDIKLVAEAFNVTTKGLSAKFSVHSCFPPRYGYQMLFPYIMEMKKCARFSFEYANGDGFDRGVTEESRPGYSDLKLFREYGYKGELGVGVIHVHTDRLPAVGTVADRALYAAKVTGMDPTKLFISPDCGLRTRSPSVAFSMLGLVIAGAAQARKEVGPE